MTAVAQRYAIADYLPPAAILAMLAATYPYISGTARKPARRTEAHECPLGVALKAIGKEAQASRAPGCIAVTRALLSLDGRMSEWPSSKADPVLVATSDFIVDWDAGVITPETLPSALGVA